jgi:hypothetical protein
LRLLRQPSRPSAPTPVANSGNAAGIGWLMWMRTQSREYYTIPAQYFLKKKVIVENGVVEIIPSNTNVAVS